MVFAEDPMIKAKQGGRHSQKSDAEKFRLAQVEKLLRLFENAHGRPAKTAEELDAWLASPAGKAATASKTTPNE